jgi:hypothetical protein
MTRSQSKVTGGLLAAAVTASLAASSATAAPQSKETTQPAPSPAEAATPFAVGQDAYVYGYPMMLVDQTREAMHAVPNRFASPGKRTSGTSAHDFVIVGPVRMYWPKQPDLDGTYRPPPGIVYAAK